MCTSQEQWDRVTAKLKGMGLSLCSHMMEGGYDEWPFVQRSGGANPRISGRRSPFHGLEMPEADFLAACKEEAIKLGVYEDRLEEGDVCMVVGPDCNGWMYFKGETVTVVTDDGPNHYNLSQRVGVRTEGGPIWLPITSLQKITTPEDDEIRVGDMVERGPDWEWENQGNGTAGVVTEMYPDGWCDVRWGDGRSYSYRWHEDGPKDIKKLKAGGPVSTNKTTNQHGQVQGTSDKDSAGAGGRTAQRPDAGRQGATGGRHQGQRASRPASRWRGAKGSLRFTV